MILIVGLGNPGKKFQKTRHNLGFRVVDEFARKNNFQKFKLSKKFLAEISKGEIDNQKAVLAKPKTFMNNSGQSVKSLVNFYKITSPGLVVVHDDINLPLGKMKISVGKSSAGHKGVQSIIKELGTKNFVRFRVGVKPKTYNLIPKTLDRFVLQKFNKKEEEILKKIIEKSIEAIEFSLKKGIENAMNRFNK